MNLTGIWGRSKFLHVLRPTVGPSNKLAQHDVVKRNVPHAGHKSVDVRDLSLLACGCHMFTGIYESECVCAFEPNSSELSHLSRLYKVCYYNRSNVVIFRLLICKAPRCRA